jgi:hypothetical protein
LSTFYTGCILHTKEIKTFCTFFNVFLNTADANLFDRDKCINLVNVNDFQKLTKGRYQKRNTKDFLKYNFNEYHVIEKKIKLLI